MEELERRIGTFVDERRGELVSLCADLVSARSANPPGRTIEAAAVVQAYLAGYRIECETLAHVDEKSNIVSIAGSGAGGRHLGLNGHLDTIAPGDEADWSVPPYELTRRDGRLYGLGMGNMKGGVAALSLAFAFLSEHRDLWSGKLSFSAVADETVFGSDGAGWLLSRRPDLLGDALICAEGPGDMQLAVAEKGLLWVEVEARGDPGQGMLAERDGSAIARLARAITALDSMNDEQVRAPADIASVAEHAGAHGLRLSVNAGTVRGGTFFSHSATRAHAEIDFRIPPGLTIADLDHRLDQIVQEIPGLSYRHVKGWNPNWTDPRDAVVLAVEAAARAVRGSTPGHVVRLPASDGSRWRALGVPAVCFGPQPLLASGVDDFVIEQDMADCAKVYALSALAFLNDATD
jgi:succinyl-diaminopimelate desuccinylase